MLTINRQKIIYECLHTLYTVVVKGLIEIVYHHALLIPEIHMHIHIQFIQKYVDI